MYDFKCIDFDFLKSSLRKYIIDDLTNIVTFYLEPKHFYDKEKCFFRKFDKYNCTDENGNTVSCKLIYDNVSYTCFEFSLDLGGLRQRNLYNISKLNSSFHNGKYILVECVNSIVKFFVKNNIYELLLLPEKYTTFQIYYIHKYFWKSYFFQN
jgi:hypothetical protein